MRTRVVSALVCAAIATYLVSAYAVPSADTPLYRVSIKTSNLAALKGALESAGYDVLQLNAGDSTIDIVVSRGELIALRKSGLRVVSVEQGRPLQEALQALQALEAPSPGAVTLAAVPAGYSDLDGLNARMQEIATAFPTIAQVVDLTATYNAPPTFEGRHVFALKISDNVATDEDEPAMLIVSNHHAREIITPVIALEAADRLTGGYNIDPQITAAVDGNEIWIAPTWNPDGYNHVYTTNNLWRKNRRPFSGGTGVDQNRNYPQGWSTSCAGSTSASSDTYKGPSAASEAETQTLMAWARAERFAKVIDYHSSGREVLYGYRCLGHPFTTWMQSEAVAISEASGYGGETRAPSAEGEHYQWQFAKMGAYAFLIETHTEFQPSYESALNEAATVWPGILRVLERPISVTGHVTDAVTGAPIAANIQLSGVAFSQGETNGSGGQFGAYHMFLPPGTYTVRFSANGYGPVTSSVTVANDTGTVLDVQLSPAPPEEVVFADDFEADAGWIANAGGTDTATTGRWERGDPQSTSSSGTKQLGTPLSGVNDLVTGRLAGASAGEHDIDSGVTSIESPAIDLPATGTITLTFGYYLAHGSNSSSADFLRVRIVGDTNTIVLEELGAANDDDGAWATATVDLSAFAGQTIRIRIEAADASGASLVEAAIDDVRIVRQ